MGGIRNVALLSTIVVFWSCQAVVVVSDALVRNVLVEAVAVAAAVIHETVRKARGRIRQTAVIRRSLRAGMTVGRGIARRAELPPDIH